MNVKPLSDRVLILPNPAEEKTAGGLIIPDTAKEAQLAVQKALSDIVGEQTIRNAQQDTKNLIDGIKDMMDGYKLSLELDTMGVPQNLASQLFGIQTFSLEDIKQRIAAEKAADKAISTGRLISTIKPNFRSSYALVKYIAGRPYAKTVSSSIDTKSEESFLKNVAERIKEFFYS